MKTSLVGLAALSCLFALSSAQAEGLLGKRYVKAGYEFSSSGNADFWSSGVAVNLPLALDDEGLSFDLGLVASVGGDDEDWLDRTWTEGTAGLSIFTSQLDFSGILYRPYSKLSLGLVNVEDGGDSEKSFTYSVGVGAELEVSDLISVTPFYEYVDRASSVFSEYHYYGVEGALWLDDRSCVSVKIAGSTADGFESTEEVGFAYRFAF